MDEIIMKVSDFTGVSVTDMLSRKRTGEVCESRKIFMYLSRRMLGSSTLIIASFLGCKKQNVSSQLIDFEQQVKIYRGLKHKVKSIEKHIVSEVLEGSR